MALWSIALILQLWDAERGETGDCGLVALSQMAALHGSFLAAASEALQDNTGRAAGEGLIIQATDLLESQQMSSSR